MSNKNSLPNITINRSSESTPTLLQRIPSPRQTCTVVEKVNVPIKGKFPSTGYVSIITDSNCEHELNKAGYIINHKIIAKDSTYVKAVDKNGNNVYVLVDDAGYLSVSDTDIKLTKSDTNLLPFSIKNGMYDLVGLDGIGVAMECGTSGICTMTRGSDMKPIETNFAVENNISFDMKSEALYSYPIVKLSEIKHHPDIVLKSIDDASRRILFESINKCVLELKDLKLAADELYKTICLLDSLRINITNSWNNHMTNLDTVNCQDLSKKYNILNNYAESLVTTINSATVHTQLVKNTNSNLIDLIKSTEVKFAPIMYQQ